MSLLLLAVACRTSALTDSQSPPSVWTLIDCVSLGGNEWACELPNITWTPPPVTVWCSNAAGGWDGASGAGMEFDARELRVQCPSAESPDVRAWVLLAR